MGIESSVLSVNVRVNGGGDLDKLANSMRGVQGATEGTHAGVQKTEDQLKSLGGASATSAESIKAFGESIRQHIETPVGTAYVSLGKLAEGFGIAGVAATAGIGVFTALATSVFESAKSLGSFGTEISNISIRTGLSTREVSEFSFAAKAAGSDIGSFEMAMKSFSKALSDNSDEGKKAKGQLDAMGISTHDLMGNLRPTGQLFVEISESLNGLSNRAEQATAAQLIFGRAGIELLPTLLKLKENLAFFRDHGLWAPNQEEIDKAKSYQREILEIGNAWDHAKHAVEGYLVAAAATMIEGSRSDVHPENGPLYHPGQSPPVGQAPDWRRMQWDVFGLNVTPVDVPHRKYGFPDAPMGLGDLLSPEAMAHAGVAANNRTISNVIRQDELAGGATPLGAQITAARKSMADAEAALQPDVFGSVNTEALRTLATARGHLASLLAQSAAADSEKAMLAARAAAATGQQTAENSLLGPYGRILAVGAQKVRAAYNANPDDITTRSYLENEIQFQLLHQNQESIKANRMSPIEQASRGLLIKMPGGELGGIDSGESKLFEFNLRETIKTETEEIKNLRETLKETTEEQKKMAAARAAAEMERIKRDDEISGGLFDALTTGLGTKGGTGGAVGQFFAHTGMDQARRMFQNIGADIDPIVRAGIPKLGDGPAPFGGDVGIFHDMFVGGGGGGVSVKSQATKDYAAMAAGLPGSHPAASDSSSIKLDGSAMALSKSAADLSAAASVLSGGRVGAPGAPGAAGAAGAGGAGGATGLSGGGNTFYDMNPATGSTDPSSGLSFSDLYDNVPLSVSMGAAPGMPTSGAGYAFGPSLGGGAGGSPSALLATLAAGGGMTAAGFSGAAGGGPTAAVSGVVKGIGGLDASFGKAAMLGASNPWATLSGETSTVNGSESSDALGTAGKIGAVGALTAAGFGVYQGATDVAKGGAYGIIGGVGKIAGSIAAVDPEPISKAILGSIAMSSAIIDAIMGDPRVQRQTQETKTLKYAHFFDPVAISENRDSQGNYSDQGRAGFVRTSPFSPVPQIQQSYADWRHSQIVPGRTISQFSQAAPTVNNYISAIDSQSVAQFFSKNSDAAAESIVKAIGDGHRITPTMRSAVMGTF